MPVEGALTIRWIHGIIYLGKIGLDGYDEVDALMEDGNYQNLESVMESMNF